MHLQIYAKEDTDAKKRNEILRERNAEKKGKGQAESAEPLQNEKGFVIFSFAMLALIAI